MSAGHPFFFQTKIVGSLQRVTTITKTNEVSWPKGNLQIKSPIDHTH